MRPMATRFTKRPISVPRFPLRRVASREAKIQNESLPRGKVPRVRGTAGFILPVGSEFSRSKSALTRTCEKRAIASVIQSTAYAEVLFAAGPQQKEDSRHLH